MLNVTKLKRLSLSPDYGRYLYYKDFVSNIALKSVGQDLADVSKQMYELNFLLPAVSSPAPDFGRYLSHLWPVLLPGPPSRHRGHPSLHLL